MDEVSSLVLGTLLELSATVIGDCVGVDRPSVGSVGAGVDSSTLGGVVLGLFLEGPIKINCRCVPVLATTKETVVDRSKKMKVNLAA